MAMIIIRIIATFFVYMDATKRGHGVTTAMLWSIGSGLVPYVILPLYFLVGRRKKEQNRHDDNDIIDIEATVVEETINCTKCGSTVKEDFLVCPYCQEPIVTSKKEN